ncbi:HAD family hydrolase [Helcobacillus massiliensis]|uniref:HAD family hydrolase n=1 Tax=Helcobacillus massiliensis TaxID=521392 RepID=UPI002557193A|nr:HAD hydrolase-like protein [Helcobacillus massiliensis]MDK7741396.1 HAD hydrolase-like protein [Helcobacillus massiliensis]WOO92757.1 HAD hydrolase-like protein [Helcobacillus massiliensis]
MSPAEPRWSTVLFDLDGTLLDTIGLIIESFHATFAEAGIPPFSVDEVRSWIGLTLEDTFRPIAPDRVEELVETYRRINRVKHDDQVRAFRGVRSLLLFLEQEGVEIGVVTAKYPGLAHRGIEVSGLPAVPLLIGNGDVPRNKPAPDPILRAMHLSGSAPEDTVYVGDAPTDIRAGQAAGVATIGVTWGAASRDDVAAAGPTHLVDTLEQLRACLLPATC